MSQKCKICSEAAIYFIEPTESLFCEAHFKEEKDKLPTTTYKEEKRKKIQKVSTKLHVNFLLIPERTSNPYAFITLLMHSFKNTAKLVCISSRIMPQFLLKQRERIDNSRIKRASKQKWRWILQII